MSRPYRLLDWGFVAACGAIILLLGQRPERAAEAPAGDDASSWFHRVKPRCNPVEVTVLQQSSPLPTGVEGTGYHAACFALAGRIDEARLLIDSLDDILTLRYARAREELVHRLHGAATSLSELYAADVEHGTPASNRVAELAIALRDDARARRAAKGEIDLRIRGGRRSDDGPEVVRNASSSCSVWPSPAQPCTPRPGNP